MSGRPSWHREGRGRIARNAKTLFLMGGAMGAAAVGVAGLSVYKVVSFAFGKS
jgi:hypothetical protein